jgi:aspartate aminotransferase
MSSLTKVYREFTYDGLHHTSILQIEAWISMQFLSTAFQSALLSLWCAHRRCCQPQQLTVMGACMKFAHARLSSPTRQNSGVPDAGMLNGVHLIFAPIS